MNRYQRKRMNMWTKSKIFNYPSQLIIQGGKRSIDAINAVNSAQSACTDFNTMFGEFCLLNFSRKKVFRGAIGAQSAKWKNKQTDRQSNLQSSPRVQKYNKV